MTAIRASTLGWRNVAGETSVPSRIRSVIAASPASVAQAIASFAARLSKEGQFEYFSTPVYNSCKERLARLLNNGAQSQEIAFAGFDETVEVHARLGIDPRQADQAVRSTVILPHGTGKIVRVLVFAAGEAERIALDNGADYAGVDEYVQKINDGWLEFDATIAMADQMGKVGGLGRRDWRLRFRGVEIGLEPAEQGLLDAVVHRVSC